MAPVTVPDARRAFEVVSSFEPAGDQPAAIEALASGVARGDRFQTLLGITGSGKSATVAWTIDRERLTLVPLALYFADGRAKLALALARGRTRGDRRQEIAQRDADLEARRAMAAGRRRPPGRDRDR